MAELLALSGTAGAQGLRTVAVLKERMVLAELPDWNFGNVDNIGTGNSDGGVSASIE